MIDLKEYVSDHLEEFDDIELPDGHEERFEAKLDAMLAARKEGGMMGNGTLKFHRNNKMLSWLSVAAAAVIAAVIFIGRPARKVDWFAGVTDDPVSVYLAYSEKVGEMYREILLKDVEGNWETTVSGIADEAVPMIDQLPEELDDASKAAIMKEYYGKLLDGLDKINKIKEL